MNNVGRIASKNWLSLVLIFLFTFSVSLVGARFVRSILVGNSNNSVAETKDAEEETTTYNGKPDAIRLQGIVNSWIAETDGRVGLAIYDLDRDEIAANYNPDESFAVGNIYQLALAYDGYRRIDTGLEKSETNIGYEINYGDCLNLMVRDSHDTCANVFLTNDERAASLSDLYTKLEMAETTDFGQVSTPNDLVKLLKQIWKHEDLSLLSWAKLQDSMLEQAEPTNDIDWRQGLPSGFSTARVYSKASGELSELGGWTTYGDLALVDFVKSGRRFAIVVLGENGADPSDFSRLGTLIEGKVLEEQQ